MTVTFNTSWSRTHKAPCGSLTIFLVVLAVSLLAARGFCNIDVFVIKHIGLTQYTCS